MMDAQCLTVFDATCSMFLFIFLLLNTFCKLNAIIFICPDHNFSMGLDSWKPILPGVQAKEMKSFSRLPTCSCMLLSIDQQILLGPTTTSDHTHCSCHNPSHHLFFFLGYYIRLLTNTPALFLPHPYSQESF